MSCLKLFFHQIREVWNTYELDLVNYQNKCRLIRGWDDLFNKVKEHINSVSAMKLSPYYKVKRRTKLRNVHLILPSFLVWFIYLPAGTRFTVSGDEQLIAYAHFVTLKQLFPLRIISGQTLDTIKMNTNAAFEL